MSRGARRFVQTFVSLMGAEAVTRLMLLIAAVIVVRTLAPSEFGAYTYAIAAASLAAFMVDLGLVSLVIRDMSAQPEQAPFLLGAFMKAQALMVAALLAVGGALALAGVATGPAGPRAFFLGFCVYAASAFARPFEATLTAVAKAHLVTVSRVVRGVVVVAATAIAAAVSPNITSLLLAAIASELAGTAAVAALCLARAARPVVKGGMSKMTGLLRLALPFALLAGFNLLYARIDLLMLGQLSTSSEVGNYGLASRVIDTAILVPAYFGAAYLATVAQTGPATERGRKQTTSAVQGAFVLCLPLAFILALSAQAVVEAIGGSAYSDAGTLLVILSANLALVASYSVLSNLQVALDHVAVLVRINVAGVVVKAGLNAWAIPAYGAKGAAAASVGVEALVVVAQWLAVRRDVELPALLSVLGRVALCAAAMVLVGTLLLIAAPWPLALLAGLAAFLGAGLLAGCISAADARVAFGSLRPRSS
jgi:O-antigen/teichoic acid export membrane protein